MHYFIISFSHKNTDISTREKLAFDTKAAAHATMGILSELKKDENIAEAMVLGTCNRAEFFISCLNCQNAQELVLNIISKHAKIEISKLKELADFYEDLGAIHHLFAVAASLDSLVVGETQIAGQLKTAHKFALENGFCSVAITRAIEYALKTAALVRNSTDISKNSVSVASAAVAKAKEIMSGHLSGENAVVVGAGEMSELCAKHLLNFGANVILVNRDSQNAQTLADSILLSFEKEQKSPKSKNIKVEQFSELPEILKDAKLLFSATGAPHTIITAEHIQKSSFARFWFDLALPRDISPKVQEKDPQISLFAVDDLQDIVKKNMALRAESAKAAFGIVGRATQEFFSWLKTLEVEPLIKAIRQAAKNAALSEISRGCKKGFYPNEYKENIERSIHNAFAKFLHEPTIALKNAANSANGATLIESSRQIFLGEKSTELQSQSKVHLGDFNPHEPSLKHPEHIKKGKL